MRALPLVRMRAVQRCKCMIQSHCVCREGRGYLVGGPANQLRKSFSSLDSAPRWRPATLLDEWVQRDARPISLRQLTVFGRSLTEARLLSSANYVRTELPTRIAHRLRDLQNLPYVVIANPHMSHVYEQYWRAFDLLRKVPEVKTVEDNEKLCECIRQTLREHMSVIPRLVMGVLETQDRTPPKEIDKMMNTLLKARISRRVIAEQHLALTETFHSAWHFPNSQPQDNGFIGEVFLNMNAKEIVERCAAAIRLLAEEAYGPDVQLPEVKVLGHVSATLTYIPSHLEYIIGELLRNSMQALVERQASADQGGSGRRPPPPPPIEVLICEAAQHVIFRVSDQGGGIPQSLLSSIWSFVKPHRRDTHLENLNQVPQLSATLQDFRVLEPLVSNPDSGGIALSSSRAAAKASAKAAASRGSHGRSGQADVGAGAGANAGASEPPDSSLRSLAGRPPDLRLGIGLPMARIFAEYWAGTLELHSLEGYGVDAFLQISKLGNRNEQLTTRASMDSL